MPSKNQQAPLTIRPPKELRLQLEAFARDHGTPINQIINEALRLYLRAGMTDTEKLDAIHRWIEARQ